jgi:hypothetical protein
MYEILEVVPQVLPLVAIRCFDRVSRGHGALMWADEITEEKVIMLAFLYTLG